VEAYLRQKERTDAILAAQPPPHSGRSSELSDSSEVAAPEADGSAAALAAKHADERHQRLEERLTRQRAQRVDELLMAEGAKEFARQGAQGQLERMLALEEEAETFRDEADWAAQLAAAAEEGLANLHVHGSPAWRAAVAEHERATLQAEARERRLVAAMAIDRAHKARVHTYLQYRAFRDGHDPPQDLASLIDTSSQPWPSHDGEALLPPPLPPPPPPPPPPPVSPSLMEVAETADPETARARLYLEMHRQAHADAEAEAAEGGGGGDGGVGQTAQERLMSRLHSGLQLLATTTGRDTEL
jgi:hypothetical protein